jgi:hypothetical protein|tara:strand:- start:2827 stop:3600 length:774 start_codon:yes stop_codon:yes gene_type:complete
MGEYATKIEDEEGKTRWAATDGKTYKTRSGAWKWSKRLESEKGGDAGAGAPEESGEAKEGADGFSFSSPETPPEPTEEVQWASFDFAEDGDYPTETVPAVLKRIKPASGIGTKKTKKQIEAEQQTSMALLGVGYRSADVLLTKYKRAVLQDKEAEAIVHSDEDIDWISGITNDALVHSDIHIANAFNPVQIAGVANLYWFGKPLYVIQAQAKRSPFKGALSGVGRFIEYVPFVGKRIRARRLAAEEAAVDVGQVVQA